MLTAQKHQVLEEMRVSAFARLNLVARTGGDNDVKRNKIRIIRRHSYQPQTVG